MASDRETIILDLQVDQGSAIQELEKTKKSIIQLKEEQKELTDAYKKGNITLEEYASETVRLEGILKKQQATYTNTQKSVTGVKTKMDDLIASNNKLANSVKESTSNIQVAGVSVGDLTTKIASFANPATAAISVVTALGAAYARSSIGAKDLEFASNQLSFATTILTDQFAALFSSVEDGEGAVSKFINGMVTAIAGSGTATLSKLAANAQEELEQIGRDRLKIEAENQDKLAENSELLTDIAKKETSITDKKLKAKQIQDNLTDIANARLELLNREEIQEKILGAATANKEGTQKRLNELEFQRGRVLKEETKQKEKIEKQVNSILSTETKDLQVQKDKTAELQKQEDIRNAEIQRSKRIRELDESLSGDKSGDISGVDDPFGTKDFKNKEIKLSNETVEVFTSNEKKKREELDKTSKAYKDYVKEQVQLTEDNFNTLAGLFSQGSEARRLFALAAIGTDTAQAISSLTAASEANPANAFTFGGAGAAQFAAGIIRILANIVAAKNFLDGGAFAGGGDFITTKPTMLLVGDNPGNRERVTVEPLSGRGKTRVNKNAGLIAMAGGGSLTFDGNKELAVASVQQSLQLKNSIKNMPTPIVSWVEGERVGKRVRFKETVSRL